jgi:CheY-like chemotaxis protein
MDFEEFFDNVLKIDSKIRFVGIYQNRKLFSKMQSGIERYLTKDETEESLIHSLNNWKSRHKLKQKIGEPLFSLSKYEKLYRVTFPLNDGLVLVTTALDVDILKIIVEIENIKNNFEWVCNVIVVDDDPDMVESLSKLLTQKKIHVIAKAFNGKEAVELYYSYKPDVLLLDMRMPEYDGVYAVNEIRKKEPNAKIIAISAYLDSYDNLNNVPTFLKPIDVDEVVEEILKLKNS